MCSCVFVTDGGKSQVLNLFFELIKRCIFRTLFNVQIPAKKKHKT